jgi:hypothetical protein
MRPFRNHSFRSASLAANTRSVLRYTTENTSGRSYGAGAMASGCSVLTSCELGRILTAKPRTQSMLRRSIRRLGIIILQRRGEWCRRAAGLIGDCRVAPLQQDDSVGQSSRSFQPRGGSLSLATADVGVQGRPSRAPAGGESPSGT